MPILRILGALLFFLAGYPGGTEKRAPPFRSADYPADKFQVTRNNYTHGEVRIKVIQAKRKVPDTVPPQFCSAWLEVRFKGRLLDRIYFEDIEPVGYKYGIFVPQRQPLPDYFMAVKHGDYDGRLLLVAKDGKITDLPGGFSFFTAGRRYIVGENFDVPELAVYDLGKGKVVARFGDLASSESWFVDDKGYFLADLDHADRIWRLDLQHGRLDPLRMPAAERLHAKAVRPLFDLSQKKDCTSRPQ